MLLLSSSALLRLLACETPPVDADTLDNAFASAKSTVSVCAATAHPTIQSGIDAAADGDTILICPGTYPERLTVVGRRLTLQSSGGAATTVVDAWASGTPLSVSGGGEVTVQGLTLQNGASGGDGGNLSCFASTLTLVESVVQDGIADRGGGLAAVGCVIDVRDSVFTGNAATGALGGGALAVVGGSGSVTSSSFDMNDAYEGGAAYISGDAVVLEGNSFGANGATFGGALYVDGDTALVGNTFTTNVSDDNGGGVFAINHDGEIGGNVFTSNDAGSDGGGLYVAGGTALIHDNTFETNGAVDEGGGLRLKVSSATVVDNTLIGNHTDNEGGGAKVSHQATTITGNTFRDNVAVGGGGGLSLEESASLLEDNVFETNTAATGGGLYVNGGWDPVLVQDCSFVGNSASGAGGNVSVILPGSMVTLLRVELLSGSAPVGGGLYAESAQVTVQNALLRDNVATSAGGGIYLTGTSASIVNVVGWENVAPRGSALQSSGGSTAAVDNAIFGWNSPGPAVSVGGGSAVTWQYGDMFRNARNFGGMASPGAAGGNRYVNPRFAHPTSGNFTLVAASPLHDVGDPAISDMDGSRSDMGLYGGPSAAGP